MNYKFSYALFLLICLPSVVFSFDSFDCMGTKSQWHLKISEDKFTFKQNTTLNFTMPAVEPKPAENMNIDHIRVFRTKANNNEIIIILQKQSCSDGTVEEVFPYEGLFIMKDKVYHGCCSKKMLISH